MKQSTFITRAISGVVFVIVLLLAIWVSPWSLSLLFLIVSLIGQTEFIRLQSDAFKGSNSLQFILAGLFYFGIVAQPLFGEEVNLLFILVLAFASLSLVEMFRKRKGVTSASLGFWGLVYGVLPFALVTKLAFVGGFFDPRWVVAFFALLWSNDTFAYITGSALGKNKLAPSLSPGKSWEGFIGGIVLTGLTAFLLSLWIDDVALLHWFIIGLIVSVFGTLGDLLESSMKRQAGVKDSGKIMPGHGGVLDRFDGLLIALPLVYLYLQSILDL